MSPVLKAMLDASGIDPSTLEGEIATRIRRRLPHLCEEDRWPRLLGDATGATVTELRRKNRHLLVELSHQGLFYRERNARECFAVVPGTLPDVVQAAAVGRRLDTVIGLGQLAPVLGPCVIAKVETVFEDATSFALAHRWLSVEPSAARSPRLG